MLEKLVIRRVELPPKRKNNDYEQRINDNKNCSMKATAKLANNFIRKFVNGG